MPMTRAALSVATSFFVALQSGCGPHADASAKSFAESPSSEQSASAKPIVIDAGIIFADEANYLCVPLTQFGIAGSEEVLSVQSTCECSRPRIVNYLESSNRVSHAVRIDFERQTVATNSELMGANLVIEISFLFSSGKSTVGKIKFLNTYVPR